MNILKIGDIAPNFSCKDQNGNIIKSSDFFNKKLVIFFYPKANTPGCTAEACNLSDNYLKFKSLGYEILGVSADNEKLQKKFSDKFNFPYSLLCDENKDVIMSYGVWGLKKFMGKEYMGIIRKTFVIDEKGKISNIIEKVKTKEHASQIIG
ncbi:MAG: thioredoxin-dependent thiol peroxidase [Flavobacteriaceae bacterium]|nr:thioredoxin-dependent thiol peroxidase [Flavobacteriaceae bacterium]|tara:strand:- start:47154 stop:47606 length:453 start_codon:yes stop_codon:yes gene_type:complete